MYKRQHSNQSINRSPSSQRSFVRVRSSPVLVAVVGFVNPSNAASRRRRRPIASPRLASPRARDDDTDHTHLVDDSRAHRIDNQSTRITRARCVTHHPSSRSIDRSIHRFESIDRSIEAFASIDRSIDPSIERPRPVAVSIEPRGRRVVASLFFLKFTSRDPSPWTRSIESPTDRRVATDRSIDRSIESPPRRPTPRPPRGRDVNEPNAPRNGMECVKRCRRGCETRGRAREEDERTGGRCREERDERESARGGKVSRDRRRSRTDASDDDDERGRRRRPRTLGTDVARGNARWGPEGRLSSFSRRATRERRETRDGGVTRGTRGTG